MKLLRIFSFSAILLLLCSYTHAQNTSDASRKERYMQRMQSVRERYMQRMHSERERYSTMRDKCNQEYAERLRGEWEKTRMHAPDSIAPQKEIVPSSKEGSDVPTKKNIITSQEVIKTDLFGILKRAEPIDKIEEVEEIEKNILEFTFLGTGLKVRIPEKQPVLKSITSSNIADMWEKFSKPTFNNLVIDCIAIKEEHNLCDWAYLHMLQCLSEEMYKGKTNEATLLTAFLYAQSGYKIRLASCNNQLLMLYASRYSIFDAEFFLLGGEKFYIANNVDTSDYGVSEIRISTASMDNELPLSLNIDKDILLDFNAVESKKLQSELYPDLHSVVTLNKNLLDFYSTYPRSQLGKDIGTQFLVYANTPLSEDTKRQLYPTIEKFIAGKSVQESLNSILNFCQTAFAYMLDKDAWGYERAFFADETLHYPFSDCEDRAILFARIVRDILNYEVILIHYPGHLACAVNLETEEEIPGDYVIVENKEYIICDPTYINGTIGETMPECKGLPMSAITIN